MRIMDIANFLHNWWVWILLPVIAPGFVHRLQGSIYSVYLNGVIFVSIIFVLK
jgi:hypothetical protein